MSDRRNQARRKTSDYFLVYNEDTDELIGRVMDLTVEGAMMISETPVEVPVGYKCRLVMPRMIGRHKNLHFEVESKWCRKNHRLGWYESGYSIINVSEKDQKIMTELIEDWEVKPQLEPLSAPHVDK